MNGNMQFLEEILEKSRNVFLELFALPTLEESCFNKYNMSLSELLKNSYTYRWKGPGGFLSEKTFVYQNLVNPDDCESLDELENIVLKEINDFVREIRIGRAVWSSRNL